MPAAFSLLTVDASCSPFAPREFSTASDVTKNVAGNCQPRKIPRFDDLPFGGKRISLQPSVSKLRARNVLVINKLRHLPLDPSVHPMARKRERDMRINLESVKGSFAAVAQKAKVRKGMLTIIAVFFVLQIYFVRELLAAELLFGMGFAVLFVMGLIFYFIGMIGERGLELGEAGVRMIASTTRRGIEGMEYVNRKAFRNAGSESAQ